MGALVSEGLCGADREHVRMARGIRDLVEGFFTQPKRRLASSAGYFPRGNREDEGMDLDFL